MSPPHPRPSVLKHTPKISIMLGPGECGLKLVFFDARLCVWGGVVVDLGQLGRACSYKPLKENTKGPVVVILKKKKKLKKNPLAV